MLKKEAMESYSQFNLPDPEQLIQCPYNKAHLILKHRFQTHLAKCGRSNGASVHTVVCKYNAAHRFPVNEIKDHEKNCETKVEALKYMYKEEQARPTQQVEQKPKQRPKGEENWDDTHCETYDPKEYCARMAVLKHVQHMTPSQRKFEREAERIRILTLENRKDLKKRGDDK